MPHARQQIREQAATELGALTTTGANVFQSRSRLLSETELPGLRIYTRNEVSERVTLGADGEILRKCELMIEGVVKENDSADDLIDTIASEVETAIGQSNLNSLLLEPPELVATNTETQDDANQPIGLVTLRFTVQYMTKANDPESVSQ